MSWLGTRNSTLSQFWARAVYAGPALRQCVACILLWCSQRLRRGGRRRQSWWGMWHGDSRVVQGVETQPPELGRISRPEVYEPKGLRQSQPRPHGLAPWVLYVINARSKPLLYCFKQPRQTDNHVPTTWRRGDASYIMYIMHFNVHNGVYLWLLRMSWTHILLQRII